MDREKIHKLLDLILEIQERGEGRNGYPYVNIEFSNYGSRIFLTAQENGFVTDGDILSTKPNKTILSVIGRIINFSYSAPSSLKLLTSKSFPNVTPNSLSTGKSFSPLIYSPT